ncbi:MAG: 23S rRNA (adenine(2503)-C(2))-methyltransferase RlmN [Gammaproteobacteria bacterium]|nr:MAG: 23S rRNA (adenine(2503)-C(2))-methyltransferase RlmN [Gammaproteobacteria bacterium]
MKTEKKNLIGLSRQSLERYFIENGEKKYRAVQLMSWLYQKQATSFSQMTNFSKKSIEFLEQNACLDEPKIIKKQKSSDGTIKILLELADQNLIETVFIPENNRGTLCVSSQSGCILDCSFCATGFSGFARNLTAAEIIGQYRLMSELIQPAVISNVVFMGMGEPLLNYKAVLETLAVLLDDNGYNHSKRRVTVSTVGVVPAMDRLRSDIDVSLAVSLHAADDKLREKLVPLNKKYPLNDLIQACHRFVKNETDRKKHIVIEYAMIKNVNDDMMQAKKLVKLLSSLQVKVNLIPYNPFSGCDYQTSDENVIRKFADYLHNKGIRVMIRRTRGLDINASCGQLARKF